MPVVTSTLLNASCGQHLLRGHQRDDTVLSLDIGLADRSCRRRAWRPRMPLAKLLHGLAGRPSTTG